MNASSVRNKLIQQIQKALQILRSKKPEDKRFHETRKKLKELRAHLRLLRTELGELRYGVENRYLRDTARLLSSRRDAHVVGDTMASLLKSTPGVSAKDKLAIQAALAKYQEELIGPQTASHQCTEAARRLQTSLSRWRSMKPLSPEPSAVRKGLKKTYRTGSHRRKESYRHKTPEHFHEWRKSVKYLRHQLELLSSYYPRAGGPLVTKLKKLGDLLGLDHDYAVIDEILDSGPLKKNVGARKLRKKITQLQQDLRRQSLELSDAIYQRVPDEFYDYLTTRP